MEERGHGNEYLAVITLQFSFSFYSSCCSVGWGCFNLHIVFFSISKPSPHTFLKYKHYALHLQTLFFTTIQLLPLSLPLCNLRRHIAADTPTVTDPSNRSDLRNQDGKLNIFGEQNPESLHRLR